MLRIGFHGLFNLLFDLFGLLVVLLIAQRFAVQVYRVGQHRNHLCGKSFNFSLVAELVAQIFHIAQQVSVVILNLALECESGVEIADKPVDRVEFSCDAECRHYRRKPIASGSHLFSVQYLMS